MVSQWLTPMSLAESVSTKWRRFIALLPTCFVKRKAWRQMLYRLNLYRDDKLLSTELLQGISLADAKAQATSAVAIDAADRAQIRNGLGNLVFYYPAKQGA